MISRTAVPGPRARACAATTGWILAAATYLVVACTENTGNLPQASHDASHSALDGLDAGADGTGDHTAGLTFGSSVHPITSVDQALPGTFIPPFEDCRAPLDGDTASRADGKVCTNVAISGCTEPGKYFPAYASCDVVRRQRPYWPAPPANVSSGDDARLRDETFLRESAWASEQIGASGCACCHDGRVIAPSQWDISLGALWIDSLSSSGLALFAGLADSSVLGAYPPAANHGFDREKVGVPSTDPERMKAFALSELQRRGLSEEWARAVQPFGGPIYTNSVKPPEPCAAGQGIAVDGSVHWTGGPARYVYVLSPGSKNPGVPPNLDLPQGTLWRLDVLASAPPLESGVRFGTTPAGSFQAHPPASRAEPLGDGMTYQLVALRDVGLPLVNCLFQYGAAVADAPDAAAVSMPDAAVYGPYPEAGAPGDASPDTEMCTLAGGDARGFGAPCADTTQHSDCPCAADYCSKSPFDSQGYCSVTGCKEDPSVCPAGWTCFDVSVFAPGQPSVCTKP